MNQAHLHLMITHLPIFGVFFGLFVLAYGMFAKSVHTQITAYLIFIISTIGACIAYYTGESAEEVVEKMKDVSETAIKHHESFAIYALVSLIVLGVISAIAYVVTTFYTAYSKTIAPVVLIVALFSLGLVSWTGYLGGKIRHTEVNVTTGTTLITSEIEQEEEED